MIRTAKPKPIAARNAHLLALARGQECLMRVPGVCNHDPATVVAAHSNSGAHGKAGARKADDHFSVWACHACHAWYDQGAGARNREAGQRAFEFALGRQLLAWARIAFDPLAKARDKAAALWAIDLHREARQGFVVERGFLKADHEQ